MIMYTVRVRAQPGRRDALLEVFRELAGAADAESGTLVYTFHTVDDDPDLIVTFELFRDADALAAHTGAPTVREIGPKVRELVAETAMTRGAPAFGKGLPVG